MIKLIEIFLNFKISCPLFSMCVEKVYDIIIIISKTVTHGEGRYRDLVTITISNKNSRGKRIHVSVSFYIISRFKSFSSDDRNIIDLSVCERMKTYENFSANWTGTKFVKEDAQRGQKQYDSIAMFRGTISYVTGQL